MQGDVRWMRMAIALATENVRTGAGGPFGAVIVRGDEVIATGANCVTATNDPTGHAEVTAIRAAAKKLGVFELTGCVIYSSCEPCPMCLGAIYWARCEALYFGATAEDAAAAGFDDAFIYGELRKGIEQRALTTARMLRGEAGESFRAWAEFERRVNY